MAFALFCLACGEAAPAIAGIVPKRCPACDEEPAKWSSNKVEGWGPKDARFLRGMRIGRVSPEK